MSYDVGAELKRFTKRRFQTVANIARSGGPDNVGHAKVLALYSRETGIRNICGGATKVDGVWVQSYEDHGLGQLNERYNREWLLAHKGCEENTYSATEEHCLVKPRLVPRLSDQTLYVCTRLDGLINQAKRAGAKDPERVGVAGWNCGLYTALIAEREHDDPDKWTTMGNYSKDVLEREVAIRRWLGRQGWNV